MVLSAEEKERFLKSLDEDKEFRYAVAGYLGISEILKRLESLEESMVKLLEGQNKLWEEVKSLREDFNKLSKRVEVTIGIMGRRWGRDLERMVLELFKETLERRGIEPGKLEKFRYVDIDGSISGLRVG